MKEKMMELRIELKSWKYVEPDKGEQKVIAGTFAVKCGKDTVATRDFNQGYSNMTVAIPATLLAKAEELDKEIRQLIKDSFEN